MENFLKKKEKELTMNFVRDKVVEINMFGDTLYCQMVMGRKTSSIPLFD